MSERDLFTAAVRIGDPAERAAYLDAACPDPALRRRVEALLAAHRRAGDFLERDPAAGPPTVGESVLSELGAGLALPRVHLRDPLTEDVTPVSLPGSAELPPTSPNGAGRYQLVGELGRGGMGAVLKGRDTDLGHDVAVKVLLDAHKGKPELVGRFVEEAQVGGQLQHPGVVPVYELGRFPDGRPFFAMKLVKGQTLATLLWQRQSPQDELPRFVQVFAQVCQALAYAHARGVIHRDLKSANVMVGAFGEVQVMDWGLAKVLRQGAAEAEEAPTQIRTARSAGSAAGSGSETRAGSVLGTPAYMAPEQANGEVDRLDERADVFGLGAVLCEILTGRPPYAGGGGDAIYQQAAAGDLADAHARLDDCGADPELIGLAKSCLAADPAGRPRDAGAVAAAVTRYQESVARRLRQAELAQAAAAARAEEARATAAAERRARRLTLGLAAAVLLLAAAGAVGGLWAQEQRAQRAAAAARQRLAVEAALDRAQEFQQQARWAEARTVLDQAADRLGEDGPEDLRQRVGRAVADLALVGRLEAVRLNRSLLTEGRTPAATAEREYAQAFRDAGLGGVTEVAAAVAARVRAAAVAEHLVAALDDWAAVTAEPRRRAWLLEAARRADPDPWGDRFRDPTVRGDRAALENLAAELLGDEARLARFRPASLAALGSALLDAKADAAPWLRAAQARHPGDFWLNLLLGNALEPGKRWGEAAGFYRAALAARPDSATAHNNLGIALIRLRRPAEAVAEFRAAVRLAPEAVPAHNNLRNALKEQGHLEEAVRAYRTAIDLDPRYAAPHNGLGHALWVTGLPDEAVREFYTAIALDPQDAKAHNNLGNVLRARRQPEGAVRAYCEAIALDPADSTAHNGLGNALRGLGLLDAAEHAYRTAIRLDPENPEPHNGLGGILTDQRQFDAAVREFQEALRLDPQSALAHNGLGLVLQGRGELAAAVREYRTASRLDPTDAQPHNNLGNVFCDQGRLEEAVKEYQAAIRLDPENARPHNGLGVVHDNRRKFDEAARAYRTAIRLDPTLAHPRNNLGLTLQQQGRLDAADEAFRTAIALDRHFALPHFNRGRLLEQRGEPDEAERAYRTSLAIDPNYVPARSRLGGLLRVRGRPGEAVAEFRRALTVDPKDAIVHFNLANALRDQKQFAEAEGAYRRALELRLTYAEVYCNLGHLLRQQGRFAEAQDMLRRGHELGVKQPSWKYPSAGWLEQVTPLADRDRRATALLKGEAKPRNPSELLRLAHFCLKQKQAPGAAARLFAEAFQAEPALAEDPGEGDRYAAATAAALAGSGQGRDATTVGENGRPCWRRQALDWLRADLRFWQKKGAGDPDDRASAREALGRWQTDPALAGARDAAALERLPEAEREAWRALWADVATLRDRADVRK
jgi:serine/threonine-protein kinase